MNPFMPIIPPPGPCIHCGPPPLWFDIVMGTLLAVGLGMVVFCVVQIFKDLAWERRFREQQREREQQRNAPAPEPVLSADQWEQFAGLLKDQRR